MYLLDPTEVGGDGGVVAVGLGLMSWALNYSADGGEAGEDKWVVGTLVRGVAGESLEVVLSLREVRSFLPSPY